MLNRQDLYNLLNLGADEQAPSLIIYSPHIGPRLEYTCEFIFTHVLKLQHYLTSDMAAFKNSALIRINYSAEIMPGIVQIIPHNLLNEYGVSEARPLPFFKNGLLYFFENKAANDCLHFDVFSAVFYFISRYEEWQAYEKDGHQRFEAAASLLYRHNFHLKPVVDCWIMELAGFMADLNKDLALPPKTLTVLNTIDVDNLFAYSHKGALRTLGACLKDVLKGEVKNLGERLKVLGGKAKDPFDVYESLSAFCLELNIPLIYFFLLRTGTAHDRTVNPASNAFNKVFTILKNKKALAGLHPSYNAAFNSSLLDEEVKIFAARSGDAVTLSRQHYLRFDIKTTPKLLLARGVLADFTMGFASAPGFRAGTSHPFLYYDLSREEKTELLLVPFCTMDGAYTVYSEAGAEAAAESMQQLAEEVKKVKGLFITVFHERTFSNRLYPGFGTLYKNIYRRLKE